MTTKKRVLLVSEAHFLASGFGTYAKQILRRLQESGKYEVAEFASYGKGSNVSNTDWIYYANMPEDNQPEAVQAYNSNQGFQFGSWRFDRVCLDFRPDIVLSYRDPWMDMYIKDCATRPYFHWVWMPTVDSAPQKQEWVYGFAEADAIFCYSEFGIETLEKQGKEMLNVVGCASPGIEPAVYKPVPDKRAHRKALGIDPDSFIVGTVMRNQKRKLFFELMKSFRLFLDRAPEEIASKSYLYLHTSYPERIGWNIADGIMQNKLGGKVLMTYICRNCKNYSAGLFRDAIAPCTHCKNMSAVCPTVGIGLTIEELIEVYNLFDLYAQYAICEGFGMPQVEAAACGIPIAATDYSAMADVLRYTQGYPIKVEKFFRELETGAERAYPDNEIMADVMLKFSQLSPEERMKKSIQARAGAVKRYDWDDTAEQWMNYIDSYTPIDKQGEWDSPPTIYPVPDVVPEGMDNGQFVEWLYHVVLQHPSGARKAPAMQLLRDLNYGASLSQGSLEPCHVPQIFDQFKQRAQHKIVCEQVRVGMMPASDEYFINDAHQRQRKVQ